MLPSCDVAVIGGGIVGLATAYRLLEARPALRVVILEKEPELSLHQSGRNSGVLHAGIYYVPRSLKARLCREGKADLEGFAERAGIPVRACGKLVVAVDAAEAGRLGAFRERAEANGVPGLEMLDPDGIRAIEPHVVGHRALWSPTTAIVDFRAVALALGDEIASRGGELRTSCEVTGVEHRDGGLVLETTAGELFARQVVACAGLFADRVAAMTGDGGGPQIVPFRGTYHVLVPSARRLVRGLVYPVPDERFPFLGVHFTPRIDGEVWVGPNAVLALAREGYRGRTVALRDAAPMLVSRGFRRLAARHWRQGVAELRGVLGRSRLVAQLQRYVPELQASDVLPGPSGVRAQAVDGDGSLVDDFVLRDSHRVLHVVNAPSPGATASLAIGRVIAERTMEQLGY